MLFDAHVHIENEKLVKLLKRRNIGCIANASTPEEYLFLKEMQLHNANIYISAGLHPWDIEKQTISKMQKVLDDTSIVGEIGLDNVWCKVDEQLQLEVFEKQLAYASSYRKPVIIHVKGKEKEAVELIKKYTNRYLIHWYSCEEYLEEYIQLGCWFTVGPSLLNDLTVYRVAEKVPLDKILIETDGLSACTWCENRNVDLNEYPLILNRSMIKIAEIRGVAVESLEEMMEKNLCRFMGITRKDF